MNQLSRKELLSILGFGEDPKHSLLWYKNNYSNLRDIIFESITEELNKEGVFPAEAKKISIKERCIQFPILIIKKDKSDVRVLEHDTDHALVVGEECFSNDYEAIKSFVSKSYSAGAMICSYL